MASSTWSLETREAAKHLTRHSLVPMTTVNPEGQPCCLRNPAVFGSYRFHLGGNKVFCFSKISLKTSSLGHLPGPKLFNNMIKTLLY